MQRLTPVSVTGLTTGATAVAVGSSHSCALVSGGVKCWGLNTNGQVGDSSQSQQLAPVDVTGLTSGVTAISAGSSHSCALTTATGMKCWGLNQNGQIGDGTLVINRLVPVDVTGLRPVSRPSRRGCNTPARWSGGGSHVLGRRWIRPARRQRRRQRLIPTLVAVQPTVKAFRRRTSHVCGRGTRRQSSAGAPTTAASWATIQTRQRLTPVNVSGLASGVVAVATGATHSCALTRRAASSAGATTPRPARRQHADATAHAGQRQRVDQRSQGHRRGRHSHLRAYECRRRQVLGTERHRPVGRQDVRRSRLTPVDVSG